MDLCANETLADRLSPKNNILNRIEAFDIFYQIVHGVTYLHEEKDLVR
jgi:hypothetical protein